MFHSLKFHLHKFSTFVFVLYRGLIHNLWYSVEGISLPINREIGFNTYRWILNGQYEQGEIQIVKKTLEKNDIVLEIGTGLGFVSSYCSKVIDDSRVFTFEANVFNYQIAKKVFQKNRVNPTIKNELLSDENGTEQFYIDKKNRLASSLLVRGDVDYGNKIIRIKLNDVIQEIKPSYLIMDIEGGEFEIFSIIDFQSIKKIQFELHPTLLTETQVEYIFDRLNKNDFEKDEELSFHPNYYFKKKLSG